MKLSIIENVYIKSIIKEYEITIRNFFNKYQIKKYHFLDCVSNTYLEFISDYQAFVVCQEFGENSIDIREIGDKGISLKTTLKINFPKLDTAKWDTTVYTEFINFKLADVFDKRGLE